MASSLHSTTRVAALLVAIVVGAGAAGCAQARRTPDDILVVLIETPITAADPRYTITNFDSKLRRLIYPGLTTVDTPTLAPRPYLAAAITRVDPLTADVELRADARFSDGSPVTADDVVRTYDAVLEPGSDSPYHVGFVERFEAIVALGPRTIRFRLRQPLATLESDLDFGIVSFHGVAPGERLASGAGLGAGPYVLRALTSTTAYLDASTVAVVRPRLPHVELRAVRDPAARILMLVGGSADLIQNGVRGDLVDDVAARPRVRAITAPGCLLTYLMMNNDDPALADVRVRQAIALALDRPAIIKARFGGRAELATGLLPPSHWAYRGDVPRWDHDVARAIALLDAAGVRDPDGPGPAPRLRLTYKTSADAFRVAVARVIAAQLAAIGIEVEVRPFEFATFFADIKKGTFQLASMQSSEITEPDFLRFYFHSSGIPDAADPDGGNRWRYRNAQVDGWTDAGRREPDLARRRALYGEVQAALARDLPIIPLWHEDTVVLANQAVRGYALTRLVGFGGLVDAIK
jgi:peptide/nickel transport system substrate-binding protein